MLRKRSATLPREHLKLQTEGLSRRAFLRRSGLASLGAATAATLGSGMLRPAQAQRGPATPPQVELKKTICPYCAVGCSIWAEVQDGVWIGQEPVFESPINMGTHCAKGAAARDFAIGHRRLKYPAKLEGGKWTRISWDQAIDEIGDKLLQVREESGPDSVYWLGSAKFSNEMGYLHRKFAAFWGTNNTDHQARICHSTTVSGVANSLGYGAMTNSLNDITFSKSIFLIGGNPAEAHPVAMQHVLKAKEMGSKLIVIDPRYTRTAAHADEYVRVRAGTDVAFMWGVLHVILQNGWEDKDYIDQRVFGFDEVRKEVEKWTPEKTENVTGVPAAQVQSVAETFAQNRPGTLIWCMGLTQSTIGNSNTRAATILQLALGNIGKQGGGANIFRGHDNVQGATDLGVLCHTLPAYYGLDTGAWKHWARVWDVDYEWLKGRFASQELMETKGMPVSRWFDGVLEEPKNLEQPNPVRAMIYWGHAPNSQTRGPDVKAAMEKLDLLVVVDPVPTSTAVIPERQDGVYLLPAGSTMEIAGSVTNTNRSVQWRERVVEPLFEAKGDYEIAYLFAKKLGFEDKLFKHISVENGEPLAEDILRELNRGTWSIGYTGQTPERLKLHMKHQDKFNTRTLRGESDPVKGEVYCLPWPSWGNPDINPGFKHPGTPILWNPGLPVAEGGLPFRARWGVEHEGKSLLAENSWPEGSEIHDGYPEMTLAVLEKLGWVDELTPREKVMIAAVAAEDWDFALYKLTDEEAEKLLSQMEQSQQATGGGQQQGGEQQQGGQQQPGQRQGEAENLGETGMGSAAKQTQQDQQVRRSTFPSLGDTAMEAVRAYAQHKPDNRKQAKGEKGEKSLREKILEVNWKTDLSGGIQRVAIKHGLAPFGNGKARAFVWNFPDPVPLHREPLYTPRRDLIPEFRTYDDRKDYRLPVLYWSIQQNDYSQEFPLILISGRLVEYEGGGDETRSNKWLAEFQQQMFAEINTEDAAERGIINGQFVWLKTPEGAQLRVAALVTERVGKGTVFMPFHFAGMWMGEDISGRYPPGTVPYVIGEASNTAQTYGYDVVTFMQETKGTLCNVAPAGEGTVHVPGGPTRSPV